MGATKYQVYTEEQIERAKFYKALGHPARIAVLEKLMESGEANFQELFEKVDLSQSTKSEHLKQLIDLGIVDTKLDTSGNRSCMRYRINKNAFEFMDKFIASIYKKTKNRTFKQNDFFSAYKHHTEWILEWNKKFQT